MSEPGPPEYKLIPDTVETAVVPPTRTRDLLLETFFLLSLPLVCTGWVQNTPMMSAWVVAMLIVRFAMLYERGDEWFLLLGILAGGGNDLASMIRGVYYYTPPHVLPWPIPLWMILFWGYVFVFIRKVYKYAVLRGPALNGTQPPPPVTRPLIDLGLLMLFKVPVYLLATTSPYWPLAVGAALVVVRIAVNGITRAETLVLLTAITLGPAYEVLLVRTGLYHYYFGDFFGLPYWLLIFWILSMVLLKDITDRMELRIWKAGK